LTLPGGFKPGNRVIPEFVVFCRAPLHAGPPFSPVARLHFEAHQFYYFSFIQAKLRGDCIEGGAVFPGHFNNSVYIPIGQIVFLSNFHILGIIITG